MANYFDYVAESADLSLEDIDDFSDVYTECDLTLAEFSAYVQEGVATKVLIGIGIAAALGGLIALIVKLFSGKSGSSASKKTASTKKLITTAKHNGVTSVTVNLPSGWDTNEKFDNAANIINTYAQYSEKYIGKVKSAIEEAKNGEDKMTSMQSSLEKISQELLDEFPQLKEIVGKAGSLSISSDTIKGELKKRMKATAQRVSADQCIGWTSRAMAFCKQALQNGKKMDKQRTLFGKLLKGTGIEGKITDKVFENITAGITAYIKNCYDDIDGICDTLVDSYIESLKEVAPTVADTIERGGTLQDIGAAAKTDRGNRSVSADFSGA